ncbi:MAG TPA: bifunctional DedA family/phosphatase PAP2 family protein [Solirubrobacterales bacterium]|jgi:undecaprenyl-diphosphatase|nr:bifunctional DedA family/phosphatase PAP2 family protein [Solirubrobacterales bacterium]
MKLSGEGEGKGGNRKRLLLVIVAAAVAFGYYLISQELGHLDLQGLLEDLSNTLGAWTYLLVGLFAFAETGAFVGLVVPGETVMLLGGAVAGQGAIDIYLLIAIAWFSAWAGDTTSFFLGRRLGREFVMTHGPRFGISHERFERVEDYFSRHGGKTIFIGRFISLVRAFAPFIAGSSGMRYRAFVPYSILGTGLWASAHILIGYFFSRSIETAAKYAGKGAFLLGTLIVVVAGSVFLYRHFRVAANRAAAVHWMEGHAATRWLVVLGRRYQPQFRFLWDRVTPGGTFGLEFTSLMAVLAVSLFVLIAYIVVVGREPGPTPGDVTAMDVAEHLRAAWFTDFTKVFTFLGSGLFTWGLTAICAAFLAVRRRWAEFGVLLAGMTLSSIGFHEIKAEVDRPRPERALASASGSSFPSGHATHSVLYVWLAVTIVLRLRPGMARGAVFVAGGIVLTVLVGLSRVYLNVHYLSDVSGGWALGAAAFSLCGALGLVISQVRQNPQQ